MKKILIDYIMGKYRIHFVIFPISITILCLIRFYLYESISLTFWSLVQFLVAPLPLILAIYNIPVLGAPSVSKDSSELDIFLRVIYLIGMMLLMFLILYFTFYPDVLLD